MSRRGGSRREKKINAEPSYTDILSVLLVGDKDRVGGGARPTDKISICLTRLKSLRLHRLTDPASIRWLGIAHPQNACPPSKFTVVEAGG